jgi:hypothetical protein
MAGRSGSARGRGLKDENGRPRCRTKAELAHDRATAWVGRRNDERRAEAAAKTAALAQVRLLNVNRNGGP